ncbi:MAG TPA: hypothetical protein VFM16_04110, partial [Holophagaceae bacterium]|nr:hypothetical protein [Holophagaceae bacterium]
MLKRLAPLLALVLLAVASVPGRAQGYDTKFKAVGFKPGDIYQTDDAVNVSLNGGGVEVSLPLGPGLPGPIPLRPTLVYHSKYSQSLNPHWNYNQFYDDTGIITPSDPDAPYRWKRWSPPSFPAFALSPGTLTLRVAKNGWYGEDAGAGYLSVSSPTGGQVSYFDGSPGARWYSAADAAEVQAMLKAVAPSWAYAGTWGTDTTGNKGLRTSDGSILIFGPYDHQIVGYWNQLLV